MYCDARMDSIKSSDLACSAKDTHELSPVGLSCLDAVKERAILQVTAVFIEESQKIVLVVLARDIPLCDCDAAQGGSQLVGHGQ